MKTWRRFQKVVIAFGLVYGLWLGGNVEATSTDGRNAFVIVSLSAIVAISMYTPDKEQEKNL